METFRKIAVSERMPSESGFYLTNLGFIYFNQRFWTNERKVLAECPDYWLEPTPSRESEYREVLESHAELFRRLNQIRNKGKIEGLENLIDRALTKARAINKKFAENDENQIPKHQIWMPK